MNNGVSDQKGHCECSQADPGEICLFAPWLSLSTIEQFQPAFPDIIDDYSAGISAQVSHKIQT